MCVFVCVVVVIYHKSCTLGPLLKLNMQRKKSQSGYLLNEVNTLIFPTSQTKKELMAFQDTLWLNSSQKCILRLLLLRNYLDVLYQHTIAILHRPDLTSNLLLSSIGQI